MSQPKIRPPTRPPMWAVLLTFGIVAPKKRLIAVKKRSWAMTGFCSENVPRLMKYPKTPPKRPKIAPDAPPEGGLREGTQEVEGDHVHRQVHEARVQESARNEAPRLALRHQCRDERS